MSRTISRRDHMVLVGLAELAKKYRALLQSVEEEMAETVGEAESSTGYFGHVSDSIYEDEPAAYIIDRLKITVVEEVGT